MVRLGRVESLGRSSKMAKSTGTDKAILVGLAGLLAWEAYALVNGKPRDTISERVWRAAAKRPLVSALIGALGAHFIWQSQDVYDQYRNEP
jgi:hypothetical protein